MSTVSTCQRPARWGCGLRPDDRRLNAPHDRWRHAATFPKHFHDGSESNVVARPPADEPEQAVREVLTFVRRKLLSER